MLRRQKHVLSQSTTPFACTLSTQWSTEQKIQWFSSDVSSSAVLMRYQMLMFLKAYQSSYSAEVRKWNFSPFFSAKGVVKFGVKFSVLRFPGFGCTTENFTKTPRQKRCENGKFHTNFTLLGRSAEAYSCDCGWAVPDSIQRINFVCVPVSHLKIFATFQSSKPVQVRTSPNETSQENPDKHP